MRSPSTISEPERQRRSIIVTGIVQGVGFRPFVYRLAEQLGLGGFVMNHSGDVRIEAEGTSDLLDSFSQRLRHDAPPLAGIASVQSSELSARGERAFRILQSQSDESARPFISPDVATCEPCLAELFDASDRRFRYPFINCTDCGPRLTIVESAPYDRERTTMRGFALCAVCRAEYEDPHSRRFHAQPNACPSCGPALKFVSARHTVAGEAALGATLGALRAGLLVAIKGIGGFHLACDAANVDALSTLRRRKGRDEKPFALMVKGVAQAAELAHVSEAEQALLLSPERPIVLLTRRSHPALSEQVAPGSPLLGVMLAYTPLHHLLLRDFGAPLVMTSANVSHEPIAYEDDDALERLSGIADAFLTHNRPIRMRCDDSVVRSLPSFPLLLRRSRGAAPRPLMLDAELSRPILALGAQSAVCFALGRGRQAFVSHHIGDLEHYAAYQAYRDAIAHYQRLFAIEPTVVAHDLHPDYASTGLARELAAERGIELVAVQHHHAHIAATMLEHGLDERVIGVAFDGTGYGSDGGIWGGEFLFCDRLRYERRAHFRALPLPGGDRAVLEPWRMAASYLSDAGEPLDLLPNPPGELRALDKLLAAGSFCPLSSGVGRLFDAVSALCGVCTRSSYDGQAAIELEWAAEGATAEGAYDFELAPGANGAPYVIDTRPLVRGIARDLRAGAKAAVISRRFHHTVAGIVLCVCERLRADSACCKVALGGGVFANAILVRELEQALPARGFELFRPRAYPPGDGGLCLGQLCVAAARTNPGARV